MTSETISFEDLMKEFLENLRDTLDVRIDKINESVKEENRDLREKNKELVIRLDCSERIINELKKNN